MNKILYDLLKHGLMDGAFPSAAAAYGIGDSVLESECIGNTRLEGGVSADENTLYDMASLTKILAPSMVALMDIERGLITLDDTIGRFFDAPPDKRDITVRMLMSHTGGFTPAFDLSAEAASPEDAVRAILAHPLDGIPGDMPRYTCMGYILFTKMLEKLHGRSIHHLAKDMVFDPLGMKTTGYLPKNNPNIAATEIDRRNGKLISGIVHDENARFMGGISGNAGVFSSLHDMVIFTQMLATRGAGLISPATLRIAIRNRTPGFDVHRGLGFHLGGTTQNYLGDLFPPESFGHTGFTGTSIAVCPHTGIWAVLLTNRVHPTRESTGLFRFRRVFHNMVYSQASRTAE